MRRNRFLRRSAAVLLAGSLPASAFARHAAPRQSEHAVVHAVQKALQGHSVEVGPNAASSMPACRGRLRVRLLPGEQASYRSAGVSCPSPRWTLYVGVTLKSQARVAITTRSIAPGAIITPADIKWASVPAQDIEGARASVLPGQTRAVSSIPPGQILTRSLVRIPSAIHSGDHISIIVNQGAIQIRARGTALQNGGYGQRIEVKKDGLGRKIEAVVVRQAARRPGVFAEPQP